MLVRTRVRASAVRMATPKFATKLSEATDAGEKFVKVFYETFDKRRQVLGTASATYCSCT